MVDAVMKALKRANIPVYKAADDLAEILQLAGEQVEYSKNKKAPETESASRKKHQPSVVSSTDGAKIIIHQLLQRKTQGKRRLSALFLPTIQVNPAIFELNPGRI